jgi:hypothetical protein
MPGSSRPALYLDTGETARFKADQPSEILLMGMPNVADMRVNAPGESVKIAAE